MATTEVPTKPTHHGHFIGGSWVEASTGKTFDDMNPFTDEVVGTIAAGDARRRPPRRRRAADAAFPAWSTTPPAVRQRIFLAAADILERRRDEVVASPRQRDGLHVRLRDVPDGLRPGPVPPGRRARLRPGRAGDPLGQSRDVRHGDPPTGRRRRRDRALERGADPVGAFDRVAARRGQHGRAQAVPGVPVRRGIAVGGDLRGGRPAGGRAQRRDARGGRWLEDRRRVRREPEGPPDQLHRFQRHGPPDRGGRRPEPQAGRPRAGRQQPAARPARRRPRVRGQRRGVRGLPPPGPDLHVDPPDLRRSAHRRRSSPAASPPRSRG